MSDESNISSEHYARYKNMPYRELAARMVELAELHSATDRTAKDLRAELDVIRLQVIPERFAEDGLTGMRVEGVGRLGLNSDAYCTVKSGLQPELYKFLADNGYGDLIRDTVNPSTLKSLVKELHKEHLSAATELNLETALDEPADADQFTAISEFVNYTPFMRATVTKN